MDSAVAVQLVLGVFGVSGIAGAIIAFLKLKPEANSMAVTQMEASNKQLEEERDYWRNETFALREKATKAQEECSRWRDEAAELRSKLARLEAGEAGA